MSHTQGEWSYHTEGGRAFLLDAHGYTIAELVAPPHNNPVANAAFIVHCVNKWVRPQASLELNGLQPFDLDAARRCEPLISRDGRKALYLEYKADAKQPLGVWIDGEPAIYRFNDAGQYVAGGRLSHPYDLFMAPNENAL